MIRLDTVWNQNQDLPALFAASGGAFRLGDFLYVKGIFSGTVCMFRTHLGPGGKIGGWARVDFPAAVSQFGFPKSLPGDSETVAVGLWDATASSNVRNRLILMRADGQALTYRSGSRGAAGARFQPLTGNKWAMYVDGQMVLVPGLTGLDQTSSQVLVPDPRGGPDQILARLTELWGNTLLMFGGYSQATNEPVMEIRGLPIEPSTGSPGTWRGYGSVPRSGGFARSQSLIWRDYLVVIGGSASPLVANSATDEIWAVKLAGAALGDWRLIGHLPRALRSMSVCVDGQDYLHVIGGIPDASVANQATTYSVRLCG